MKKKKTDASQLHQNPRLTPPIQGYIDALLSDCRHYNVVCSSHHSGLAPSSTPARPPKTIDNFITQAMIRLDLVIHLVHETLPPSPKAGIIINRQPCHEDTSRQSSQFPGKGILTARERRRHRMNDTRSSSPF